MKKIRLTMKLLLFFSLALVLNTSAIPSKAQQTKVSLNLKDKQLTEVLKLIQQYNLNMASDTYETLLRQMPEKQRNVFIAISAEGEARSVKSGAFAKKYHLPSPSSVNSALKGLLEKDFITQQDDAYVVYDKFFDLWLKKYLK